MVTGSNILDSFELPALVTGLGRIVNSGGGYTGGANKATTGGSGTGLTVSVTADLGAGAFVTNVTIFSAGTNYLPGDLVTISGDGDGTATFLIDTVAGTPVQHNGFLLSGSNTLFTTSFTGPVEAATVNAAGASGTTGIKATTGGGNNDLTINVTDAAGGALVAFTIETPGTGYSIGDVISVTGFNSSTILITDIEESSGNAFLPFATSESINEPAIKVDYRLEMAGPQLALYHTYNKLVESQSVAPEPASLGGSCPTSPVSQSQIWVKSGLDPQDTDNYYSWYPSGSNCVNYADYQQPFLINRGDVIRVEGLREIFIANSQPSQSLAFNKEFTVLGVQNFCNSASSTTTTGGAFIENSAASFAQTPVVQNNGISVTFPFNSVEATNDAFQTSGAGISGSITLTSFATSKFFTIINTGFFTTGGSSGYAAGDTITISQATLNASAFGTNAGSSAIITLNSTNIESGAGFGATGFTLKVDGGCWSSTTQYKQQPQGAIQVITPTFLEVTPDPIVALDGLQGGAITKYTVRREIEQDDRVMIRGVQAPSGSKGTETQSGGGYIIPNDLSLQQKSNAVNIINQLRAKNAFPTATPNATT
tara:strand:- start:37 stop:1824 length:1788 start_codon:yes stop_codon:yes gene_type:complete